jgi:hypothetical protein
MSSSISSSASMPAFAARRFAAAEEDFLLPLALALRLANARASSLATMPSPVFLVRVTVPPMAICWSASAEAAAVVPEGGGASAISASVMSSDGTTSGRRDDFESLSEAGTRARAGKPPSARVSSAAARSIGIDGGGSSRRSSRVGVRVNRDVRGRFCASRSASGRSKTK